MGHMTDRDWPERETMSDERVPKHVGIIMDGNGRWAAARGLPRLEGHRRGVEALRRTIRAAIELNIRYLTVYSFSTENWSRPVAEVDDLMFLLKRFIRNDLAELHRADVRVKVIGIRDGLKPDILGLLREAEDLTQSNGGLTLVVAFNYGGRQELASAVRRIAERVRDGSLAPEAVTVETVADHLDTAGIPRSRPHRAHVGRAAAFQFPHVAKCLRRVRVHARPLAGLRPRSARRSARRLHEA